MLEKQIPSPVKLICGIIYSQEDIYHKTIFDLERKFGQIDLQSQRIDFDFTDYYYPEMGKPLFRKFISFKKLRSPCQFINIKLFCLNIEKKYSKKNKRTVNIDPGYINEAKVVLTTTKDFSHRIYLSKGVFAEVVLYYKNNNFCLIRPKLYI